MLEIVDALLGADGGEKFSDRAQNSDAMPQIAHPESLANTQIEHPDFRF
jgi:hypothetical protein